MPKTAPIEVHTVEVEGKHYNLTYKIKPYASSGTNYERLTDEQAQHVVEFSVKYGRTWKDGIKHGWLKASMGPTMHRLRNTHGPAWLATVNVEAAPLYDPVPVPATQPPIAMIRHMPVLAFAQTEVQSTGPCGIVLVEKDPNEWVTAWYRLGDSEWCYGHYFDDRAKAYEDFIQRVQENLPRLRR